MRKTTNLELNKPEQLDDYNVDDFNENADIVDSVLGELPKKVEDIEQKISAGVGDFTEPAIAQAPAVTTISDTSSVPVSSFSGVLNRITFANVKAILRSVYDTIYALKKHDSDLTDFGAGTVTNYGHVKTVQNVTTESITDGEALGAHQGKVLDDKISTLREDLEGGTAIHTTVLIPDSAWVGDAAPYTAIVAVAGILSTSSSVGSPNFTTVAEFENGGEVVYGGVSGDGYVIFRAFDFKPTGMISANIIWFN